VLSGAMTRLSNPKSCLSIENDLSHTTLEDRMAANGFGPATKVTAQQILDRLKQD